MAEQNQQHINNFIILSQRKNFIQNGKSRMKDLTKSIYDVYDLNKIGSIKYAKIHRSANRPLYKNKNRSFNRFTEFCQCCNLPAEQKDIMETFNFCDDPESFAECGEGVSLYFTFFKFSIMAMLITFLLVSIHNIIISKIYYEEIYDICNNKYNNKLIEENCKLYLNEFKENSNSYSLISNSFFFMFNSINTKYYRNLYYKLNLINGIKIENIIINTSFMNFLCSITLFIFNLVSIIIINFNTQEINISILSLSDYSIFLTNLKYAHNKFLKIKLEIDENKKNAEKQKHKFDYKEELFIKLGIDKSLSLVDLSELDQFIYFIKNKICVRKNGEKLNIKKINLCFKISELMALEEKLNRISEKMSKIKNHPYQISKNEEKNLFGDNREYYESFLDLHCCEKSEKLKTLKEEEKELKNKIDKLMEKVKENTMDYFAGSAIVCLDTIKEHEDFLNENKNNLIIFLFRLLGYLICGCCININKRERFWLKKNIRFERAPEPEDIIFENIEYVNSLSRIIRTFLVYFCSFLLICICFIIVTTLNYLQKYIDEKKDYHIVVAYIISLLISCCISIINLIFEKILDFLTKREKQSTTTNYYLSKSIKLTFFSFINQGIIPLISELYIESNGYEYLIINMLMIFLVNAFLIPISWTLSFSFIYKKFRIWLIERNIDEDDNDGNHEKTQKELNELYELPSMDIAEKYSYIFKTLLLSFFYIPIFPLGTVISCIGFFLGYFLEKYNFCNMYKRPEMLNDELCKSYINNFIVALFISGIGDYIFKYDVYKTKIWPLTNIILFGILTIIPYHYLIDYFAKCFINLKESNIHKNKLDDVYFSFFNDYERANPMTKREGIKNYLNGLKERGIISEKTYNENTNNLDNVNLMKIYYDDRNKKNYLKTQKTIMIKDKNNNNNITIMTIKTLSYRNTIKEDDIKNINIIPDDAEPTKIKELSRTILISNNNNDNINKGNEPLPNNSSSNRNFAIQ